VHLRLGEIHDAEAITAVINLAFRVAESFLMDRDRMDLESVQSLLTSGKFLLADHGGAVAGCVYIELKAERAYLGLLSVDPKHQKAGVGSRLMNAAEDYCARAGCRFMDLQVINLRQELPRFYRNRGYIETGTAPLTPGLRPKLPCHFVKMSKQLT
jgi:GNAT superfamily N-acetyltransferase